MKRFTMDVRVVLCVLFFSFSVWAQEEEQVTPPVQNEYPYLLFPGREPVTDTDNVRMAIMVGEAPNACSAPGYTNVSFTIEETDPAAVTPQFTIYVTFTEVPSQSVCLTVYLPVDKGPSFTLGKLSVGAYRVVDGETERLYGTFVVGKTPIAEESFIVKGTVYNDPSPLKIASMPIEGAMVYLRPRHSTLDTPTGSEIAPVTSDSTKTDEKGIFSFGNVQRGYYQITIMHEQYRNVSEALTVTSDTSLSYTMIAADASASLTGTVGVIESPISAAIEMLPGCTVTVSPVRDPAISAEGLAVPVLRTITGEDGKFSIEDIPIDYNGQVWYVTASKNELNGRRTVTLSNGATVNIGFALLKPFGNSAQRTVDGIRYRIATDKFQYLNRETVKVRYSITNTTDTDVEFGPFSGGCEYDLEVTTRKTSVIKQLYRASDQFVCLDVEAYIMVKAGETVTHDFPDYLLPDLRSYATGDSQISTSSGFMAVENVVQLQFAARLRGENYDSSLIGVPIRVEIDPPPVSIKMETASSLKSGVLYNRHNELLQLNLSHAQNVGITVHTLAGAVVRGNKLSRYYNAGAHALSLRNVIRRSGMFIVTVKGRTFEKRFKAIKTAR